MKPGETRNGNNFRGRSQCADHRALAQASYIAAHLLHFSLRARYRGRFPMQIIARAIRSQSLSTRTSLWSTYILEAAITIIIMQFSGNLATVIYSLPLAIWRVLLITKIL